MFSFEDCLAQICLPDEKYNYYPLWEKILPHFYSIIYLGSNHNGITCGLPKFWAILAGMKCVTMFPDKKNNMIFYINEKRTKEEPLNSEEINGLSAIPKRKFLEKTALHKSEINDQLVEILAAWRNSIGLKF